MGVVMPRPLRASLALLGAAAVLAGCGGSGSGAVTDKDGVLRLRLDEYRITPSKIRVRAGRIRILATNTGVLTHNVRIEQDSDAQGVTTPVVYGGTATMQPGTSAPGVTIRLFPGKYRILCTIGNHENLGQYAELTVTP